MTSRHNNDVWKLEEQYLLRIRDANLAERLRDALYGSESEQLPDLEIIFNGKFYLNCNIVIVAVSGASQSASLCFSHR